MCSAGRQETLLRLTALHGTEAFLKEGGATGGGEEDQNPKLPPENATVTQHS